MLSNERFKSVLVAFQALGYPASVLVNGSHAALILYLI
jgi:hypothetical protein